MSVNVAHLGLAIDSPLVRPDVENFRPQSWPPSPDFPIVIDAKGKVVSQYGDSFWDLSLWAKKSTIIYFGEGVLSKRTPYLSPANADLLRQIVAWWIYGPVAIRKTSTLLSKIYCVRLLFSYCSQQGVNVSDLRRFPAVAEKFYQQQLPSWINQALAIFHTLYQQRDQLGFVVLDNEGLVRLEAALPSHEIRQTPYIPPRIWVYQVNRLRFFLDEFVAYKEKIEACYHYCLEAYAKSAGSIEKACQFGLKPKYNPFWLPRGCTGARSGQVFHGRFAEVAKSFGIDELLIRWVVKPDLLDSTELSIRALSTYFSMVSYVGIAYLLNFSLMRIEEGVMLSTDCLEVEYDERFGSLYSLRGITSKTVDDGDARWPTSPSAKIAVDAMACIARLRMVCAQANPDISVSVEEIRNPYLFVRTYEPWSRGAKDLCQPLSIRPNIISYSQVLDRYPNLFDLEELRITKVDLQIARLITPTLDGEKYSAGSIWPLAWHQLRRSGSVNMQASGLISDSSLQYLLKHTSRAMSLYYGQGYSQVRLNDEARNTYIRTMYEMLGKEISGLFSDRFVSPHGDKRKAEILKIVDLKDSRKLSELAKSGKVSWRETLLGGCTKRGPCTYGGIDNVAHCGGGDGGIACADVLYDREKLDQIRQLGSVIASRLAVVPADSPYRESLYAQQRAVENALNVIKSC